MRQTFYFRKGGFLFGKGLTEDMANQRIWLILAGGREVDGGGDGGVGERSSRCEEGVRVSAISYTSALPIFYTISHSRENYEKVLHD